MSLSLSFPDQTYTASNKPSVITLKADLQEIETGVNEHIADTSIHIAISSVYPIGSIYINASDSTNPGTLLGFGTWASFGAGKVLLGVDTGDSDFNASGKTGGAKTHTLTTTEMPSHTHGLSSGSQLVAYVGSGGNIDHTSGSTLRTGVTISSAGSGGAHNNLQPYITVYMWKRTA